MKLLFWGTYSSQVLQMLMTTFIEAVLPLL
jgi:hypothetical protein